MKKISIIGLFFILLAYTGNAQGVYSKQSLAKDSLEVLNLHLEKAHKLKKTGVIMSIAGPVGFIAGTAVAVASYAGGTEGGFVAGSLLLVGGLITTAVGLPILITGSTRVKRVKTAINNHQAASLNLAPVFVYNNKNQSIYPGLKLNFRF